MRVALVHDWLTGMRGGERCLEAFLQIYPRADIFTLLHVPGATSARIDEHVRGASFLQRVPGARRWYRALLPLYPLAIRGFDLRGYDMVVSLSHAAAKNVSVPAGVPHMCYCFTPMRYVWDQTRSYLGRAAVPAWPLIAALRAWDRRHAAGVTQFAAISRFVAARVRCFYRRHAEIVYPPVDTSWIAPAPPGTQGEAFLYAGALVPYKRADTVVEAFNRLGLPLWVAGDGPLAKSLRSAARSNIKFFGRVSDETLAELYRRCRALVFPGVEDFGLMPVECMAAGRPVIAACAGGLRESIAGIIPWNNSNNQPERPTGVFVKAESQRLLDSLISGIYYFAEHEQLFEAGNCVAQARRFAPECFFRAWAAVCERAGAPAAAGRA